jgi:NAD(P)-dependent dehydrogenase (short-subunit alcohol dehydrogenase family)
MNRPVSDWRGRRVWIFGASSGIGAALARELLARGARVAVSARRADRLRDLAASSSQALAIPCDAVDAAAVAAAADAIRAAWGGIDSAFYVAGDYVPMRAWAIDLAAAEKMIAANLSGAVTFAAAVLPHLLADTSGSGEGSGDIAFVASVAGYRGLPKALVYGPTKAALINFAETMAIDLQPKGVGVRIINPGFVATPLTAQNDFSMPALQSPEQAAVAIVAGYRSSAFEIHFPKRFTRLMKLLALLPACLYLPLIRRLTH